MESWTLTLVWVFWGIVHIAMSAKAVHMAYKMGQTRNRMLLEDSLQSLIWCADLLEETNNYPSCTKLVQEQIAKLEKTLEFS
jgi:hypothetical protein